MDKNAKVIFSVGRDKGASDLCRMQASTALSLREASDGLVCCHCFAHLEVDFAACSVCEKAWHLSCVSPQLPVPPEGAWTCPSCLVAEDGPSINPRSGRCAHQQFQADAQRFFRHFTGSPAGSNKVRMALQVLRPACNNMASAMCMI